MVETTHEIVYIDMANITGKYPAPTDIRQKGSKDLKQLLSMKKALIVVIFLAAGCRRAPDDFQAVLESPAQFDGKEIELTGVLHFHFEDVALYPAANSDTENAIWLDITTHEVAKYTEEELATHKVRLRGVFNKNSHGHLGSYAGELNEVHIVKLDDEI